MVEQPASPLHALSQTTAAILACGRCHDAVLGLAPGTLVQTQDRPHWQSQQQLWLLMPSVLLPCAIKLLLPAAGTNENPLHQQHVRSFLIGLIDQCSKCAICIQCVAWLVGA
jgi:hypothetical protein